MNCKPGDLAVIVRVFEDDTQDLLGKVIRVTKLRARGNAIGYPGDTWEYEGKRLVHSRFGEYLGIADELLRPIRPGDISDDEVRELYAPTQPEIDERFAAAHYQDGRDLYAPKQTEAA